MIPSFGPAEAKVLLVFDCPLNSQIGAGSFMGGYVGNYTKGLFQSVEGGHSEVYKTFLHRESIPGDPKNALQYITQNGKGSYTQYLLTEINELNPNVLIVAGEASLQYFTGFSNIKKYRGSILSLDPLIKRKIRNTAIKVVPILPFEEIRKDMRNWYVAQSDIRKAWTFRNRKEPFKDNAILWICKSATALSNYLNRNRNPEFIATDIELWNGFIDCVSLCTNGVEGVCIPLLGSAITITDIELALIYKQLAEYLNSGVPIINQNVRFDEWHFRKYGFVLKNIIGDTMILGATIYPELPKNLGFYNSLYTNSEYFKDEGKEVNPTSKNRDKRYIYNAKDSVSAHRCFSGMKKDAKEIKIWDFYNKGPVKFYPVYSAIEQQGIRFSEEVRTSKIKKYKDILMGYEVQYQLLVGKKINVNSAPQIKKLIYDELELPSQTEIVVRADSSRYEKFRVDEGTLEFLVLNFVDNEDVKNILYLVIYLRKLNRIIKYLQMIVHPDGRIRTRYKESGTESGRTATTLSEDVWYREMPDGKIKRERMGVSLQTVPKHGFRLLDGNILGQDIREVFVPDKGFVFGEADYKQIEARIVAICCKDFETLNRFDKIPPWTHLENHNRNRFLEEKPETVLSTKADIHVLTTAQVLDIPQWKVTKWERESRGKRARHAGNYGMQEHRLSELAQISIKDATDALDKFHESNPLVQKVFHRITQELIRNKRTLWNPFGRRRDFLQRVTRKVFKIGYSWYPQSTCSDCTKFAMVRIYEQLKNTKFSLLGEFHDGLWWQSPKEQFAEHASLVKKEMEQSINFEKGSFPLDFNYSFPIELGIGEESWGNMQSYET